MIGIPLLYVRSVVSVRIPKVRSKNGQPVTFRSALVPPYVRRTKTLEAALPWLYLKGVSSGEMGAALKVLLGPDATGLSANTVSRLKRDWAKEYAGWRDAAFDDEPIVYIWADGVHSGLRGENDKLCALVIIGVTARGKKRFLAIEDGVRESTQSWREVLLSLKRPLPARTPVQILRARHLHPAHTAHPSAI
jgi:putative transposase